MIVSHTNPDYALTEHLQHTRNIALKIMPKTENAKKYGIEKLVRITTEAHDLGKATTWFQEYLHGKYNGELKDHAFISACFAHYVAGEEDLDVWQRVAAYFIVLGHHGGLKNKKPSEDIHTDILQQQATNILRNGQSFVGAAGNVLSAYKHTQEFLENASKNPKVIIKKIRKDIRKVYAQATKTDAYENVKRFLITKMAYSLLVTADTISAALRTDKIDEFVDTTPPDGRKLDQYVEALPKRKEIDRVRSIIYKQAKNTRLEKTIHILELPTGAGKTFSGTRIATTAGRPLIYTLPYTSIIDQTVSIFQRDDLYDGNVMPYHHLTTGKADSYENISEYQSKLLDRLIEGWFSPITVTTYEQVMYALTWDKKRFNQRLQAIGRDVLLFDEIQALPFNIWDATWYVLRAMNELFETPILVMSATVPEIPEHARDVVVKIQIHLPENAKNVFVRRVFEYHPDVDTVEKVANLVSGLAKENDRVLCVVNTRCDAYQIYSKVKDNTEKEVILLSTHIPPKERLRKIRWAKEHSNKWVIISTQVIEAGVDIDANVLVRDIAPLDSIVQSAGRCNRNGEQRKGKVIITEIKDDKDNLRAKRVYNGTIVETTRKILIEMPDGADDGWIEQQMRKYYIEVCEKTRREAEMGPNSIPTHMGKMEFEKVREQFKIIQEIPSFQIVLADKSVKQKIEEIRQLKERMKSETNYENRIRIARKIRALRTKVQQNAVTIYKPSSSGSGAQKMLEYLMRSVGDALRPETTLGDDTFVLDLDRLSEELRRKTEEVGISWICEAKTEDADDQMDRFA